MTLWSANVPYLTPSIEHVSFMSVREDHYLGVRVVVDVNSRLSLTTRNSRLSKSSMPDNTGSKYRVDTEIQPSFDGPPNRTDGVLNVDVHFREGYCGRSR